MRILLWDDDSVEPVEVELIAVEEDGQTSLQAKVTDQLKQTYTGTLTREQPDDNTD